MRLNSDERGDLLGAFKEDDKIISIYQTGNYRITGFDLSTHFEDNLCIIQKHNAQKPITAVYENKEEGKFYMKRFFPESTDKKVEFLGDEKTIRPIFISYDHFPQIEVESYEKKPEEVEKTTISCADFVEIMSLKARGKRISFKNIVAITPVESLPDPEEEEVFEEEVFEEEEKGEEEKGEMEEARRHEGAKGEEEKGEEEIIEEEIITEEVPNVPKVPRKKPKIKEDTKEQVIEDPKNPIKKTKDDEEWEQLTLF